jgi:hypothetical protein
MRNHLRLVSCTILSALSLASACVQKAEPVGSASSALCGNTKDASDANANVAVALDQYGIMNTFGTWEAHCTGTLVSPLVVLTAGHCVVGAAADASMGSPHFQGGGPSGLKVNVQQVGSTKTTTFLADPNGPMASVLVAPAQNTDADTAKDLAVIFLDPGQMDQQSFKDILDLYVERPLFSVPPATQKGTNYTFTPPLGVAGYTGTSTRSVGTFSAFTLNTQPWGALWDDASAEETALQNGDSGGPLFAKRGDGSRDVVAVNSNSTGCTLYSRDTKEADVTNPTASGWIKSKVVDPPAKHTQTWLCKHHAQGCSGQTYPDRWLGETEYGGPCQPSKDADCDHWLDADDNCPSIYNPSQTDADDDGYGDACPCPCDTANGLQDYDGDGVCAVACAWQKTDNCPKVANADQANCNAAAEVAQKQAVWGDACDPVPCPASNANATTHSSGPCSGSATLGGTCTLREIHDEIDTTGTASHQFDWDSTKGHNPFHPDTIDVPKVTTEMRFCQSNPSMGFDCHAAANIGDMHLADPEPSPAIPANVWHKVTQGKCTGSCFGGLADDARGGTYVLDYTDAAKDVHGWDYAADYTYWTTNNLIPPADASYAQCTGMTAPGTCLDGTWWSHADTPVGNSTTPMFNGNAVGSHGDQLANHYFDVRPDALVTFTYSGIGVWRRIMLWRTLPDPWYDATLPETRYVVSDPGGAQVGVLRDDGTASQFDRAAPGSIVSPAMQSLLGTTTTLWASAVEPSPTLGMVDSRVEAIALSPDGTSMLGVALDDAGVLRVGDEVGFPAFVTRATASHPTTRTGPLAFFSSSAGGVFMMGGTDPSGGTFMHDMWFRQMGNDWRPVPAFGYTPDRILAATFSFSDQRLYVLDHTVVGNGDTARLERIDFRTGATEALGACPLGASNGAYYLTVDNDGTILVTAAGAAGSAIGHLAVDCTGNAYVTEVDRSEGPLVAAPIVDSNGYSLLTGTTATVTRRVAALGYGAAGTYPLCGVFQ